MEKTVTNDASTDTIELNLFYKPTVLKVRKIVAGYNLEPDKAFSFTIQANAPEGTDADAAILGSDLVYIKKGNGTAEKLTFTNNQAAFTLKKDEFVDISCLPTGWTYTVTETAPGTNFEVSYSINSGSKTVGEAASFTMAATGTEDIQFTNTSTVAPPVTGRNIQNNHDADCGFTDWHGKHGIFQKSKKKISLRQKRKNCACEVKNLKV